MSIEIVTGFQGVEHIEPAQVGRLLASLVGTECYAVGEGDPLSATVRTANQVRIGAGEIIMQGRHITCESYTDLTIESGTTGYKRNDLVVCRYERSSSTGVESATLKVVKGTATTGTPSDPSYASGSIIDNDLVVEMPLWRIPITNLTPGTPVKLFSALPYGTLDSILDRVSAAKKDIDDLRDSIFPLSFKNITAIVIGAEPDNESPQLVTLSATSNKGRYTLIVTEEGIALWDHQQNKTLWAIDGQLP